MKAATKKKAVKKTAPAVKKQKPVVKAKPPKKAVSGQKRAAAAAHKPLRPAAKKKAAKPAAKKPVATPVTKKITRAAKIAAQKSSRVVKKIAKTIKQTSIGAKKKLGPKPASSSRSMLRKPKAEAVTKRKEVGKKMPRNTTSAAARTAAARNAAAARRGGRGRAAAPPPPPQVVAPPPKKARFKADELRKLRQALEQERERLLRDIRALDDQALTDGLAETISQQPGFSLQLADSASDNQQVDTALGIRSIELDQLMQIDEALRMIDDGDYGICHRCGETISLERLLVKPMAKYCVPCRHLLESGKA